MIEINTTFQVKFVNHKTFANGGVVEYLLQTDAPRGKKIFINATHYYQGINVPQVHDKDVYIDVRGTLYDNRYKDTNDEWKSRGVTIAIESIEVTPEALSPYDYEIKDSDLPFD